ncbi:MAG TPA: O-antigen ligase family protein [Gammaproteobacteria bacterium]
MRPSVFMLAVLVVYAPSQGNFPTSLGVMGLNVFNILFVITLATLILQAGTRGERTPRPPLTNVLIAYYAVFGLALLIALLGGTPHAIDDVVAYKELVSYSFLYFLAYYGVRRISEARGLIFLVLFLFAIASFEAIIQGVNYGLQNFEHAGRASGPFGDGPGNSNFAGVFYAIFASFSLAIALLGKHLAFRFRLLAMAAYGIGCLAIFATFSRQAMLIIGVTTLLLALRRNPLVAALAVGGMLAYPLWAPQGIVERIEMTQQESVRGEATLDRSAASRYELWGGALEIVKRNPMGVGLNQFQLEIEPYLPAWVAARDAQNMYLRFAAEAGIQGLVVFLLLLGSFFRLAIRIRRLDEPMDANVLGTAFLVSVLAVCLGNIFSSTFAFGAIMANFWIMAGLLARYLVIAEQRETGHVPTGAAGTIDETRRIYSRWQRQPGGADRQVNQ